MFQYARDIYNSMPKTYYSMPETYVTICQIHVTNTDRCMLQYAKDMSQYTKVNVMTCQRHTLQYVNDIRYNMPRYMLLYAIDIHHNIYTKDKCYNIQSS